MNHEYQRIQNTLKAVMKSKKATYQTMARALQISPATVKRRLNGNDLSLQQLKEFAEALSISFYELIELSKKNQREPHLFTEAQEKFLSRELTTILAFRLILAGQDFPKIKSILKLSEKELRSMASGFEKVGLAQLIPGDRLIPLVRFPVQWRPEGLLSKAFDEMILENIFEQVQMHGKKAGLHRQFEFALSQETYKNFCQETEEVFIKYRGLSELQLSSKVDLDEMVSGILYIDRFSIWDRAKI